MSTLDYRPLGDDAEGAALCEILALCFGTSPEDSAQWLERQGSSNARLVTDGGRVAGGLFLIPMGQWFGGHSVPMAGIAAVGVDPADRAGGAGTHLMRETVRELYAQGTALSALYPAVQPLYRRAGYEQAGAHFAVKVSTQRLFLQDRGLEVRRAIAADVPEIERLHQGHGRENAGNLDRNDTMWRNVREPFKGTVHAFVVEGADGLEGYLYYVSKTNASSHQDLFCVDLVARTPAAARRLLTFFRDHRSLVDTVNWRGHPSDPLLLQCQEQRHQVRLWDTWMLRIVHLENALTGRGYPQGLDAEVHLEIVDDLIPENEGRWILRVEDGQATVTAGGDGHVHLDVRTLAPLYTGFASPAQLRSGHGLVGSDESVAKLAALFAGPAPWMQDGF